MVGSSLDSRPSWLLGFAFASAIVFKLNAASDDVSELLGPFFQNGQHHPIIRCFALKATIMTINETNKGVILPAEPEPAPNAINMLLLTVL